MEATMERAFDLDAPGAEKMLQSPLNSHEQEELQPFESVTLPSIKMEQEDEDKEIAEEEPEEEDFEPSNYVSTSVSPVKNESEAHNESEEEEEIEPSSFVSVSMTTVKDEPEEQQQEEEEDDDDNEELEPLASVTVPSPDVLSKAKIEQPPTTPWLKNFHLQTRERYKSRTNKRKRRGNSNKDWNLATWNVRGVNEDGSFKKLISTLREYKISIAAIQETKWNGKEMYDYEDYTICKSGTATTKDFGTAFIIHKDVKNCLINFNPVNERLCSIRLRGKFFKTTIICAHAPAEDEDDNDKDAFYDTLNQLIEITNRRDIKIILGDMNAMIGTDRTSYPHVGRYTLHEETNDNGDRLVNLAKTRNMSICSTHFPHKLIHEATWVSPDYKTANQVDHVLIDIRHKSDITDVRSYRGADCNSDHILLRAKYHPRISSSYTY